jgi:hypothetical protein
MKIVSESVISSLLTILDIEYKNIKILTKKINKRISLNKKLYSYLLISFFIILKILKILFFFVPSKQFYIFIFKLLSNLPSPLNLINKLICSYILLDCYE